MLCFGSGRGASAKDVVKIERMMRAVAVNRIPALGKCWFGFMAICFGKFYARKMNRVPALSECAGPLGEWVGRPSGGQEMAKTRQFSYYF